MGNIIMDNHSTRPKESSVDVAIAGKTLVFYWRNSRFFMVTLVILSASNSIMEIWPYAQWAVAAFIAVLLTWWLVSKRRVTAMTAVTAGIYLGLMGGLVFAVFEIIWYHRWWYALNLVRDPFLMATIGAAASFVFYLLCQNIFCKKLSQASSGGTAYEHKRSNTHQH